MNTSKTTTASTCVREIKSSFHSSIKKKCFTIVRERSSKKWVMKQLVVDWIQSFSISDFLTIIGGIYILILHSTGWLDKKFNKIRDDIQKEIKRIDKNADEFQRRMENYDKRWHVERTQFNKKWHSLIKDLHKIDKDLDRVKNKE